MRACMSVFARWSGEVCAEGGVREGERRTWKEGVCEVIHVFAPRPCSYGNVSI